MNVCKTALEQKIYDLILQDLQYMGYEIVRIRIRGGAKHRNLQVMLEKKDGTPIVVKDCENASYQISALLDVADPIEEAYDLEVSSPGVDKPLTRNKDFLDSIGQKIKLTTKLAIAGQKKFIGVLKSYDEKQLILQEDNLEKIIDVHNISEANLVFIMNNQGRK